jgi:hypothetical protein
MYGFVSRSMVVLDLGQVEEGQGYMEWRQHFFPRGARPSLVFQWYQAASWAMFC